MVLALKQQLALWPYQLWSKTTCRTSIMLLLRTVDRPLLRFPHSLVQNLGEDVLHTLLPTEGVLVSSLAGKSCHHVYIYYLNKMLNYQGTKPMLRHLAIPIVVSLGTVQLKRLKLRGHVL